MSIYDNLTRCESHHVRHMKCDICEILHLRAQVAGLVGAIQKYKSECQPHPCSDLVLRRTYREKMFEAAANPQVGIEAHDMAMIEKGYNQAVAHANQALGWEKFTVKAKGAEKAAKL